MKAIMKSTHTNTHEYMLTVFMLILNNSESIGVVFVYKV